MDGARAREFARSFLVLGPHAGAHRAALRAGVSVFVPLIICVATHRLDLASFAAFGAFTSLYGRTKRYPGRAGMQATAAAVFTVACSLGAAVGLLDGRRWWIVLVGAIFAGVIGCISDAFEWHPPGALFPLFAVTVCSAQPPSVANVFLGFVVALASALFSIAIGQAGLLREPGTPFRFERPTPRFREVWASPDAALRMARLTAAVGVAGTVGNLYGGAHPYWAMVASIAALTGRTRRDQVTRGMHRLVGTILGVGVAGLILPLHPRGAVAVLTIMLLQIGAELLVGRNYGLAMLCVTPLALTMGQLAHEHPVGPLLFDRAMETFIGCGIGLLALALWPGRMPGAAASTAARA